MQLGCQSCTCEAVIIDNHRGSVENGKKAGRKADEDFTSH